MEYFSDQNFAVYGIARATEGCCHFPTYYGIQLVMRKKLYLRIDRGREFTVPSGHVFLTYPEAFFEYGALEGGSNDILFLCFDGARVRRYVEQGLFRIDPEQPLIKLNNMDKFYQTMLEIFSILDNPTASRDRAVLLTEDLLLQLREQDSPAQQIPAWQSDFFKELLGAIQLNPEKKWDFDKVARKSGLSAFHFRRLFKQYAGIAPLQFLIRCRMRRAANLLSATPDKVSEIATQVGIDNEFYFSRLFKKKYNLSPQEYRKSIFQ